MTDTTTKVRSLFLTALLVVSVFGGTIAFTGAAAASNHGDVIISPTDDGKIVFQGQTIGAQGFSSGEKVNLRRGTPGGDNSFVKQYTATNGEFTIDTAELSADSYYLVGQTSGDQATFEVAAQTLDTSFDPASVENEAPGSTSELTIESNRGGTFDVQVTSSSFDDSELATLYNVNSGNDNTPNEDGIRLNGTSAGATLTLDFAGESTGNYSFTHEVVDTTASDTANITVNEPEAGSVSFVTSAVSEQRGDVVSIELSVEDDPDNTVNVSVGGSNVNFLEYIEVEDTNEDGSITLQIDTSSAGTTTTANVATAYSAAGDDEVVDATRAIPSTQLSSPLAAADYDLSVALSDGGNEQDVAVFSLTERATTGANTWIAPEGTSFDDASDVPAAVTDRSNVAMDDLVVVQVEASGLYGYTSSQDDLNANGLSLTVEQTDATINADANTFNSTDAQAAYFDAENNTFFVVFDTAANNIEAGEEYEATFTVSDGNQYVAADESESVSTSFTVEERVASFDANDDGEVVVEAESNQTVTGTTNVAPGTEFSVRAKATGTSPFLKTASAEVTENGTFSGTFDFSNVSPNTTFTLTVPNQDFEDDVDTTGVVAPAPSASVSISDQSTDGTTVTVDSVTLSEGGFVTIHDGTLLDGATFDSVRGTSAYLEAGEHSDVEVTLDTPYEEAGTAIAMPHLDTNDNEAYDFVTSEGAEDGPYVNAQGEIVLDDASLTVETPTATPTPGTTTATTETATATVTGTEEPSSPTPSPTPTPGQPGFGFAVAIVALVGAALIALRRE